MKGITFHLGTQTRLLQGAFLNSAIQRDTNSCSFSLLNIAPLRCSSPFSTQLFLLRIIIIKGAHPEHNTAYPATRGTFLKFTRHHVVALLTNFQWFSSALRWSLSLGFSSRDSSWSGPEQPFQPLSAPLHCAAPWQSSLRLPGHRRCFMPQCICKCFFLFPVNSFSCFL